MPYKLFTIFKSFYQINSYKRYTASGKKINKFSVSWLIDELPDMFQFLFEHKKLLLLFMYFTGNEPKRSQHDSDSTFKFKNVHYYYTWRVCVCVCCLLVPAAFLWTCFSTVILSVSLLWFVRGRWAWSRASMQQRSRSNVVLPAHEKGLMCNRPKQALLSWASPIAN